jgi:hypothetical protein
MLSETNYQEDKIKNLLYEMSSLYSDIRFGHVNYESGMESFKKMFEQLIILCLAYFEVKNLLLFRAMFEKEVSPLLNADDISIAEGCFKEDADDFSSNLVSLVWSYLAPFPGFELDLNKILLKQMGHVLLRNILESTGYIIKETGTTPPKQETEVTNAVKIFCEVAFPGSRNPKKTSLQKKAKAYFPDILIPDLKCAIEYKYAESKEVLTRTIDEILIDVAGYNNDPHYKIFYAVFYVEPGVISKPIFWEIWEEKNFPQNWIAIFIEGIQNKAVKKQI